MDVTSALSGLSTALQYVCPVGTSSRDKPAHDAPPSILIIPERTTFGGPTTGAGKVPATQVRSLANAQETLLVMLWARDHAQLRDLRAAFVTACKQVLGSFALEPAADYVQASDVQLGEGQTLRVSFLDYVPEIALPTTAPADDTAPVLDTEDGADATIETITDDQVVVT